MAVSIQEVLRRRTATSREIQIETGLSQTAVSRQLRLLAPHIVSTKQGRSPKYMLTCAAFGGDDRLPLTMVDAHGNNALAAYIRPLAHGGYFVQKCIGMPDILLGKNKDGVYDDLPYFLDDLRPQGFLGRQIAAELSTQSSDFPDDPRHWNASHVGRYLVSNGDDLPGNFKFGQQAHLRVRRKPVPIARTDYPVMADAVMRGAIPGSSAGGEQPKFTGYCDDCSSHVIVKFSPQGDDAVSRRWRDILITEFHATESLHAENNPAAETMLIEAGGRLFLESQRFDRAGEYGRMSLVSLQAADAEFAGMGSGWPRVMQALYSQELVSWQHVYDVEILWAFGRLINNTDMHLGNFSLGVDGSVFRIRPVYDMCCMGFAPKGGDVLPYEFEPDSPAPVNLDERSLRPAFDMAYDFWERVSGDSRISSDFRRYLAQGNPVARLPGVATQARLPL